MMTCPDVGQWRALVDGELEPAHRVALEHHLAHCARCRSEYDESAQLANFAAGRLPLVAPSPTSDATALAWRSLHATIAESTATRSWSVQLQERISSMFAWLDSRPARVGVATGLAGLVIAVMLVLTPMGSMALQGLSVFRVTTFKALTIEVDPATMPKVTDAQRKEAEARRQAVDPARFRQEMERELAVAGITVNTNLTDKSVREVADLAAARGAANGATVRTITALPAALAKGAPTVYVADASKSTLTADVAKLQQALRDRAKDAPKGATPAAPAVLPGIDPKATQVSATVQTSFSVMQQWGEGETQLVFAHGPSPVITLSEGIDVQELCLALRASPVMSKTNRAQLDTICADKKSLESTLFIPVPQGATVKDVRVGGIFGIGGDPALLVLDPQGKGGAAFVQRDGILYVVAGGYGEQVLLQALNSIR